VYVGALRSVCPACDSACCDRWSSRRRDGHAFAGWARLCCRPAEPAASEVEVGAWLRGVFEHVYIMSLASRADRRRTMVQLMRALRVPVHSYSFVDAVAVSNTGSARSRRLFARAQRVGAAAGPVGACCRRLLVDGQGAARGGGGTCAGVLEAAYGSAPRCAHATCGVERLLPAEHHCVRAPEWLRARMPSGPAGARRTPTRSRTCGCFGGCWPPGTAPRSSLKVAAQHTPARGSGAARGPPQPAATSIPTLPFRRRRRADGRVDSAVTTPSACQLDRAQARGVPRPAQAQPTTRFARGMAPTRQSASRQMVQRCPRPHPRRR
jgi:hypothetical protein